MKLRTLTAPGAVDLRLTVGVATMTDGAAWWTTRSPDGPATLRLSVTGLRVEAAARGPGADWVLEQTPALLGFDDRPEDFNPRHRILGQLVTRLRGLRIGRTDRAFEAVVPAILGQKVASEEAHRNLRALNLRYGNAAPWPGAPPVPASADILAVLPYWELHELGIERHRADLLRSVAKRASRLEEICTMSAGEATERLLAFPGVGPWTAALVAGTARGDPDAVLIGDYHLPDTVCWALAGEARGTDERMLELLEPYRGHRGRVIRMLKAAHLHAPRYGPRAPFRSIERI